MKPTHAIIHTQLSIFDQLAASGPITYHFPDSEPITTDAPAMVRIKIPRDTIRAFISGQVERLTELYSGSEYAPTPTRNGNRSSTFHC